MLSVRLVTGGYGAGELLSAGAFRVYRGAGEFLRAIDELGDPAARGGSATELPHPASFQSAAVRR